MTYTELALDLALAFHHAVQDQVAAALARLRETRGGDFVYYSDIVAFMAGLPSRKPQRPAGSAGRSTHGGEGEAWSPHAVPDRREEAVVSCWQRLLAGCGDEQTGALIQAEAGRGPLHPPLHQVHRLQPFCDLRRGDAFPIRAPVGRLGPSQK